MVGKFGFLLLKPTRPDLTELLERFRHLMELIGQYPRPPAPPGGGAPPGPGHMETRIEDGRIWTPYGLVPPLLNAAIQQYWPIDVWTDAARVSWHESKQWDRTAVFDTRWRANNQCGVRYWFSDEVGYATTEWSIGYFQINACAHGHDLAWWTDPDHNVKKGADLFFESGWRPWEVTARRLGLLG